jgi:hypothetical protein
MVCVENGRGISALPATERNPLSASRRITSSIEAKWDGTQMSNAVLMRLEDDFNQSERKL